MEEVIKEYWWYYLGLSVVTLLALFIFGAATYNSIKSSMLQKDAQLGWFQEANGDWHQMKIEYECFFVSEDNTVKAWIKFDSPTSEAYGCKRTIYLDGELLK